MRASHLLIAAAALASIPLVWRSLRPVRLQPPVSYVDSAQCAGCHAEIWKSYRETGMGRSFSPVRTAAIATGSYYHPLSDRHYTMVIRDGRLYQTRHQVGPRGEPFNVVEKEVNYILGSGNHSRSFLHRTSSGKLTLLPLAWYAERGGFVAMNPGYDRPDHKGFQRAISYDCMFCHNAYPAALEARPGDDPVFPDKLPAGIDCQRCHGPGQAHVAAAAARQTPEMIRQAITNPKRLSRDRNLEVCLQCHLETTSRTLPYSLIRFNRGFFSYRPGEPLREFILHFDHAPGTGNDSKFEIAHAAYRLRKSACFRRSQNLTCTTCHNPHRALRGAQALAHYRTACQSCHPSAHHPVSDCSTCHMPKRRTDDVIHVVMTDHFIQRQGPRRDLLAALSERHDDAGTAYRGEVVPYYPEELDEELYMALAQVAEGSNLSAGTPRLEAAIRRHQPEEAMFYFELAEALWKTGQRDKAIAMYREALRRRPDLLPAIRNLGAALLDQGELTGATEVLARAPADPVALSNLGDAFRRQQRLDAAIHAYREAIARDPDLAEAHHGLAQAQLAKGDVAAAGQAFVEAIRIRPDYAEAHYNWGTALGQQGDLAAAEFQLLLAVKANPRLAAAHNNLGMVAAARGDLSLAVSRFRKALELDPGNAGARANLERALAGTTP